MSILYQLDFKIVVYVLCGIGIIKIVIQKIYEKLECKKNYQRRLRGCKSKSCNIRISCIYSKYYYIKNNMRKRATK